ncbi:MAG TPA: general stress protein CsbD, partial [Burkholderiales bacterium]|nr:general stress protein CsbD [Burkholderiales bacterium]
LLTDEQVDVIAGRRDLLQGRIQELYGISKEETEKQLSEWEKRVLENAQPGDTTMRPPPK